VTRLVLDSNIWISAFQFGGKAALIVDMALAGELEIAISQPIVDETGRILRNKFGWDGEQLNYAIEQMLSCTRMIAPTQRLDVVPDDKKDNIIIECAVAAGSGFIVTGDKDLLRMKEYQGIPIIQLREFLQR
jgi:putative PIN family toxin of toxin-antitoxin system